MAKKQFIRHLEYYGFPDQNTYTSLGEIDLSDIREKNKEQDEEIQDLEGEKANKKDLDGLSGTVESLISIQSEINQGFSDAISGISEDIDSLKNIDDEFAIQLSAMTDAVDELIGDMEDIDESITDINNAVSGITESVSELGGKVDVLNDAVSGLSEDVDNFKNEVEENYSKKDDVYTKEEIDEMVASGFSGYATVEWVEAQGYITEDEADTKYATSDEISGITDSINALTDNVEALADDFDSFKEETNGKIESINDAIDNLVDSYDEQISALTEDVAELQQTKTDKTEFNQLANVVDSISSELGTKASKHELDDTRIELQNQIDTLGDTKADKTDLNSLSGTVGTIREDLDAEIARATAAENALGDKLDIMEEVVESAVTKVESYETRVSELESGLAQEILDRKQGDLDLIGTSEDTKTADTIWGAKNFAKSMKNEAVSEAKEYTDSQVAEFESELNELREDTERQFSNTATKEYVNQRTYEIEQELEGEFNAALQNEIDRATLAENNLFIMSQSISAQTSINTSEIAHNATRINSITSWDGSDPEEYDDSGNGVLDVLHREFHEFEKTHGSIKEIRVEDGNLIIVYYTKEGEEEVVIPVGELIDLSNYYTKEETDAVIQEAISHIDLSNYYTKDETDAKILDAVGDIDDEIARVEEKVDTNTANITTNTTNIATLFNNLGYANNDTLETSNPNEAAFGQYNLSNTGEEPSGQTIFSIGIGTSNDDRKNAVEVRNDGTVYMWIEGDFMPINNLLGMLAHEIY